MRFTHESVRSASVHRFALIPRHPAPQLIFLRALGAVVVRLVATDFFPVADLFGPRLSLDCAGCCSLSRLLFPFPFLSPLLSSLCILIGAPLVNVVAQEELRELLGSYFANQGSAAASDFLEAGSVGLVSSVSDASALASGSFERADDGEETGSPLPASPKPVSSLDSSVKEQDTES